MQPIWRDYFVTLGTGDSAGYSIMNNEGNIIYSGKAYKRPNESEIKVKINDVCANYLGQQLPPFDGAQVVEAPQAARIFAVYDANMDGVAMLAFANDWSYNDGFVYTQPNTLAADPVNGKVQANQLLLFTMYYPVDVPVVVRYKNGTETTITFETNDYAAANIFLRVSADMDVITINGVRYTVVDACADYALYYVNAYGGWDSLLIEGATSKKDAYTRHEHRQVYDNSKPENRGVYNYLNEVRRSYTMVTGWLSDAQSQKISHLLGSTLVYIYDFTAGEFIPVTLTNSECEYKTYAQQGNKLVNYTIEAVVSQTIIRK